ncbi:MAG: helix-turn-helix domain-containing protein [Pseudonocardia sp.]
MPEGADELWRRADLALAAELRRRRLAVGWSQAELANRVGYSREYVSRAERASKGLPSAELVRSVDAALGADGALVSLHDSAYRIRLRRRHCGDPGEGDVAVVAQRAVSAPSPTAREVVGGGAAEGVCAIGSVEVAVSERVHELFVRAQSLLSTNDRARIEAAVSLLDRALEIEPQFARARAARGYAAWRRYFSGWDRSSATLDAALRDVGTALSRDPHSVGARTTLIRICWDMDGTSGPSRSGSRFTRSNPRVWTPRWRSPGRCTTGAWPIWRCR